MQNAPTPPTPPTPPAPPAPLPPDMAAPVQGAPLTGIPVTEAQVRALRERREELSNQLQSAAGRRNELAEAMEDATGANREGLEARLRLLDQRILQLETDIAVTGQALSQAPRGLRAQQETWAGTTDPSRIGMLSSDQVTGISIVFTIAVLMPMAIGMARLMWKRALAPARPSGPDAATTQRLERMEQGIDGIATEIERVSEAQRFLTRLLAESRGAELPALGVGQRPAEPVRVAEGVRVQGKA